MPLGRGLELPGGLGCFGEHPCRLSRRTVSCHELNRYDRVTFGLFGKLAQHFLKMTFGRKT
jgi:hypothetical protein